MNFVERKQATCEKLSFCVCVCGDQGWGAKISGWYLRISSRSWENVSTSSQGSSSALRRAGGGRSKLSSSQSRDGEGCGSGTAATGSAGSTWLSPTGAIGTAAFGGGEMIPAVTSI